jgi:hypothetical protein
MVNFSQEMAMQEALPRAFRRIRLELARERGHPSGDALTGYTLVAPIDEDGRLDAELAREFREACQVVRFRRAAESDAGVLRRRPGGSWAIHYDFSGGVEDDDPGYRLGEHRFAVGEYVTIAEDDGPHTYRVVSVEPL